MKTGNQFMDPWDPITLWFSVEDDYELTIPETDEGVPVIGMGQLGLFFYKYSALVGAADELLGGNEEMEEYIRERLEDIRLNGQTEYDFPRSFKDKLDEWGVLEAYRENTEEWAENANAGIMYLEKPNFCDCGVITVPVAIFIIGSVLAYVNAGDETTTTVIEYDDKDRVIKTETRKRGFWIGRKGKPPSTGDLLDGINTMTE